ncbi:MAG: multidrug MFS transporter [Sulfolobus sp.]|nr:multidrug MFS transporter [Sulfolobus sp.]
MRIYADYREEKSGVPELLKKLGALVILENLSVGDYVVGEGVIIERKSVTDFVKSIFDKRLFDQVSKLKETSSNAFIILEGSIERAKRFTSNWNAVLGALVSIQVGYGIGILLSSDVEDTAYLIYKLGEKFSDSQRRTISLVRKPKLSTLRDAQFFVVQSFPNIGPVLAEKLLERFGSIKDICNASISDLQKVLGEKRAEELFKLINSKFNDKSSENQKINVIKKDEKNSESEKMKGKSSKRTLEDFMS